MYIYMCSFAVRCLAFFRFEVIYALFYVLCFYLLYSFHFFFFFFSSRRRHTRCLSDWSSDVCSSDLFGTGIMITGPNYVGTINQAAIGNGRTYLGAYNTTDFLGTVIAGLADASDSDRKSVV